VVLVAVGAGEELGGADAGGVVGGARLGVARGVPGAADGCADGCPAGAEAGTVRTAADRLANGDPLARTAFWWCFGALEAAV